MPGLQRDSLAWRYAVQQLFVRRGEDQGVQHQYLPRKNCDQWISHQLADAQRTRRLSQQ